MGSLLLLSYTLPTPTTKTYKNLRWTFFRPLGARSRRQVTMSIADCCCISRSATQWGLGLPLLQSCFVRKAEDHVRHDKWPLPIWGCSYSITCWQNINIPFKQTLHDPFQITPWLFACNVVNVACAKIKSSQKHLIKAFQQYKDSMRD
jgi:hypothetical protein